MYENNKHGVPVLSQHLIKNSRFWTKLPYTQYEDFSAPTPKMSLNL